MPFALSETGEKVVLSSAEADVLTGYQDVEDFGASETGVAFGRYRKSTATYNFVPMSENTPGWANATGFPSVAEPPEISHDSGVYQSNISVTLSTDAPGAVIRYSLDWSEPTASSPAYSSAVLIDASSFLRARVRAPN